MPKLPSPIRWSTWSSAHSISKGRTSTPALLAVCGGTERWLPAGACMGSCRMGRGAARSVSGQERTAKESGEAMPAMQQRPPALEALCAAWQGVHTRAAGCCAATCASSPLLTASHLLKHAHCLAPGPAPASGPPRAAQRQPKPRHRKRGCRAGRRKGRRAATGRSPGCCCQRCLALARAQRGRRRRAGPLAARQDGSLSALWDGWPAGSGGAGCSTVQWQRLQPGHGAHAGCLPSKARSSEVDGSLEWARNEALESQEGEDSCSGLAYCDSQDSSSCDASDSPDGQAAASAARSVVRVGGNRQRRDCR